MSPEVWLVALLCVTLCAWTPVCFLCLVAHARLKRGQRRNRQAVLTRNGPTAQHALMVLALAWGLLGTPSPVLAHTGPPFVVLSEQQIGPYTTTVWADPDVGTGTFIIEADSAGAPLPESASVTISAWPSGAAASAISGVAERQQTNGGRVFLAMLPLASEGNWEAQIVLDGPAGRGETTFQLQVTPAVEGWVTTLICMLPFIGLGIAWLAGLWLQRRRLEAETR